MTTAGGGWTLIYKTNMSSNNDRTENGYSIAALLNPTANDVAVLPTAVVNRIGTTFRTMARVATLRL